MTPRQAEALRLWRETGSKAETARRIGVDPSNLSKMLLAAERAEAAQAQEPEGVTAAKESTGTTGRAKHGWRVVPRPDGGRDSVFWAEPATGETDPADLIRAALADMMADAPRAFPPRPPPTGGNLLMLDLADVHIGKLCVLSETGHRYDRSIAVHRMREGARALLRKAAPMGIGQIALQVGNDELHVDNSRSTTTSGTYQDTDGSVRQMYSDAYAAFVAVIEACAEVAPVDLIHVPANHNWMLGWCLAQQLGAHFRLDPRVTATPYNLSERHRKYYRFERNLIGLSHGDGAKEADLYPLMMTEARPHIAECEHRYIYLHHLHHKIRKAQGVTPHKREKDHIGMTVMVSAPPSQEGDNVQIEHVRSPSPPDGWHDRNGYVNRQAVECFVHHPHNGQEARFTEWF